MARVTKAGVPVIGIVFLVLAIIQFMKGDPWVVWAILGFLFGGFGIFTRRSRGDQA